MAIPLVIVCCPGLSHGATVNEGKASLYISDFDCEMWLS